MCGQNLSIGVVGGASATSDFQNQSLGGNFPFIDYSTPKRYVVGAMLEYRFTSQISMEADGLFHPLGYTFAAIGPGGSLNSVSPAAVITWEFPVLAKYRFAVAGAKPFIEAGPSLRTTGNLNSANPSHYGFTGGAGIETHWRNVNIAPVIRYTRWAPESHVADVRAVANQLELLVAFSGTQDSNLHPLSGRVSLGAIAGLALTGDFRSRTNRYVVNDASIDTVSGSGARSFLPGAVIELRLPGSGSFPRLVRVRLAGMEISGAGEISLSPRTSEASNRIGAVVSFTGRSIGILTLWSHRWIGIRDAYTRWGPEKLPEFAYGIRNQLELLTSFSF